MTKPLLQVENLVTSFTTEGGKVEAVKDISFVINRGETLGIVGESGSGKSVTSLSIMRLLASNGFIEKGHISFTTENKSADNLISLSEKELQGFRGKHMSMVFQEPMSSLNPVMRCGEQVEEAIRLHLKLPHAQAKEKVLELFQKVELPDPKRIYQAYPHQLSGGQKQRVMIAMAISCQPDLIIADEPTTALDVTVQKSILELLKEIQLSSKCAVLFITHDLGVVAEVADRIAVMYQGEIVEQGTVQDIFKNPQHPYTKSLIACRPPLNKKLHRLPTVDDFLNKQSNYIEQVISIETIEKRREKLRSTQTILQVNNLSVSFPIKKDWLGRTTENLQAVDQVSFSMKKGETLGLVGESGSGKTTLGRAILRLSSVTDGEVIFEGKNILNFDQRTLRNWRKGFQIIFQDPASALNPRMTIGQAIMEPMKVHDLLSTQNLRYEKAIGLLEKVGLDEDHFHRYPHEFSGGQKQRACIARALALEPRFIICDESVSALDVSVQAQVLNLLLDLQMEFDLTYIFISHDLSVVQMMSDRILVMNKGKIVEHGYPEDIFLHPKEEYTKTLIEAIPKGL